MRQARTNILIVIALLLQPLSGWAERPERTGWEAHRLRDGQVRRNYHNTSRYLVPSHAIVLEGTTSQILRLSFWLDQIVEVPHGRATLEAIHNSGNRVTIRHSEWALQASGRTQAPATAALTDGTGADVVIHFDARIPDSGSHLVFDANQGRIEFTAVQNLYHELAHARHMAMGTWRYFDSEGQAIEEENRFRRQYARLRGEEAVSLRAGIKGRQVWSPDTLAHRD